MDTVFIRQLEVDCVIGVHPWERRVEQRLLVDLELGWDMQQAAETDALADALDYSAVADTIRRVLQQGQRQLLEAAAGDLVQALQERYGIKRIRLQITKPGAVARCRGVGIEVQRSWPA